MAGKQETAPVLGETMTREKLEQFSDIELITYARMQYDLKLSRDSTPRDEVLDIIVNAARRFKGNSGMTVVPRDDKRKLGMGMVKVRVSPGPHNPNERPIIVGLNFEMASIPCNRDIIMDEKWLVCLQHAIRTNYRVGYNEETGKEGLMWNEENQYPYSVIDRGPPRPTREELAAKAQAEADQAELEAEIAERVAQEAKEAKINAAVDAAAEKAKKPTAAKAKKATA